MSTKIMRKLTTREGASPPALPPPALDKSGEQLQGWLFKLGVKGIRKTYKKRWFELDNNNCLHYFKSPGERPGLGHIDLSQATQVKAVDGVGTRPFQFVVITPARLWTLVGETLAEQEFWVQALSAVMHRANTKKGQLPGGGFLESERRMLPDSTLSAELNPKSSDDIGMVGAAVEDAQRKIKDLLRRIELDERSLHLLLEEVEDDGSEEDDKGKVEEKGEMSGKREKNSSEKSCESEKNNEKNSEKSSEKKGEKMESIHSVKAESDHGNMALAAQTTNSLLLLNSNTMQTTNQSQGKNNKELEDELDAERRKRIEAERALEDLRSKHEVLQQEIVNLDERRKALLELALKLKAYNAGNPSMPHSTSGALASASLSLLASEESEKLKQ